MTNRLLALFAFTILLGFLGILVYFVPRPDLMGVVGITVLLVAYDFFVHSPPSSDTDT